MGHATDSKFDILRKKAEEIIKGKTEKLDLVQTESELLRAVHTLEVFQIELELQNEELKLSLERSENISQKYTSLYDFAPIAYFTLSEEGVILNLNLIAAKMLGKERSFLKGKAFEKFTPQSDLSTFNDFLAKSFDSKKKEEIEIGVGRGIGYFICAKLTAIVENVHEECCLLTIQDITERKAYEQSMQELNRNLEIHAKELALSNSELEQFAYVASHDLQEPLRMVSSFLSLLERKYKNQLDEKALQYIDFAVNGAVRMRQIILDLLEYSRVGKQNAQLEWVQLPSVVEEIKQLQRKIIQEKKAEIKFEGIETLWTFKPPLLQIMQNLIGNALKYSKPDVAPEISILAIDLPGCWQISVSDNGLGIKEEYFDKIFILFQRLHRKEEYEGTGIGLAIVKKIVEGLGGKIWVESEYQKGSIFHFTIAKPTT
ncbi:MAG: ATP-binding protein [Algoriphagus sp.]|uniref:sensor histidine kinase n=2 Tax=Algoriphagus sp. TaxID=1872435 RepID=UPI00273346FE|nr:PAS domain-containing sensor histidine kinase [Algoriphagus sp.]MDP3472543.1 ATP-binding protein [Algoriphagus sp.]